MVIKIQRFGKLNLQFTSSYTLRWNDQGSGGNYNGGFWHPIPPAGFYALGSIGLPDYSDPNGSVATLCVQEYDSGNNALAKPVNYDLIWADHGSGSKRDGSCWRPIPPDGYIALGDVFSSGYDRPSLDDVRCVQKDLVHSGLAGDMIWNDRGTGSNSDFGAWRIMAPDKYIDETQGLIAPNALVGVATHIPPSTDPVMHVLQLPIPSSSSPEPQVPILKDRGAPPSVTISSIDRVVTVPFTAINDTERDVVWKLQNSPFYLVEREVYYSLVIFNDNNTNTSQTQSDAISVGITKSQSDTFSVTTGISVSTEAGVSVFGTGGSVSMSVSLELGWSTSTSVEEFRSQTVTRQLTTPPNTSAAMWSATYKLRVLRGDESKVGQPLTFESNNFVQSQYPSS
jgi:hypothetical protein